jgi:hypothetical protein
MYEDNNNIAILVKLFETLKDSSKRSEEMTQHLVMQQVELVNQIKNVPVEDLKGALKEHAKESLNEFDACSGTIETRTSEIKIMLANILSRINKMILVVSVTFMLFGSIYTFARIVADDKTNHKVEAIKQEIKIEQDKMMNNMIEEIRKEMQQFHKKDDSQIKTGDK